MVRAGDFVRTFSAYSAGADFSCCRSLIQVRTIDVHGRGTAPSLSTKGGAPFVSLVSIKKLSKYTCAWRCRVH